MRLPLLAAILPFMGACEKAAAGPDRATARPSIPVATEAPRPRTIVANGVVEARGREVALSARAPGVIARVVAAPGVPVSVGAPLLALEQDVERAELAAAEAALREAEALYQRARRGARPAEREAADAASRAAMARAMRSDDERLRVERLADAGAAAESERARAGWLAEADRAAARQAAAEETLVRLGLRAEDLAAAAARRDVARAHVDRARAALARMTIRAPTDGAVLRLLRRVGERVAPDEGPTLVFGDTTRLQVRVAVDEREAARVRPGATATVTVDAAEGTTWEARVAERGFIALPRDGDPGRAVEVVLTLERVGALVPGMRAVARIDVAP